MVYDIAVVGAGCAGWQLLYQLSLKPEWESLQILLLEEYDHPAVYPSWCFWTSEPHPLEFLSTKQWGEMSVAVPGGEIFKPIAPYRYLYIDGKDFYHYFNQTFLPSHPNIHLVKPFKVQSVAKKGQNRFYLNGEDTSLEAKKVYSTRDFSTHKQNGALHLSQNFTGWHIEFNQPVLDENRALFMDFRQSDSGCFEFMYILPFTSRRGLVEWTTFIHPNQLEPDYEASIEAYLASFFPNQSYRILEKEHGAIPMTNYPYSEQTPTGVIHIGTAAGMIKPSTGYTFNRITRDSISLAGIAPVNRPRRPASRIKFQFYDTLLLKVLRDEPGKAKKIFFSLFSHIPFPTIFKFLDEQTSWIEDIRIFSRLPVLPLIRAIFKR